MDLDFTQLLFAVTANKALHPKPLHWDPKRFSFSETEIDIT